VPAKLSRLRFARAHGAPPTGEGDRENRAFERSGGKDGCQCVRAILLTDPFEFRMFQFAVRDQPALRAERQQYQKRTQNGQADGRQTVPGLGHRNQWRINTHGTPSFGDNKTGSVPDGRTQNGR